MQHRHCPAQIPGDNLAAISLAALDDLNGHFYHLVQYPVHGAVHICSFPMWSCAYLFLSHSAVNVTFCTGCILSKHSTSEVFCWKNVLNLKQSLTEWYLKLLFPLSLRPLSYIVTPQWDNFLRRKRVLLFSIPLPSHSCFQSASKVSPAEEGIYYSSVSLW